MTRQGQSDERQRQEAPGAAHAGLKYQILREARQTGTPVSQVCAKHATPAHTAGPGQPDPVLPVGDTQSPNHDLVHDYCVWFANR